MLEHPVFTLYLSLSGVFESPMSSHLSTFPPRCEMLSISRSSGDTGSAPDGDMPTPTWPDCVYRLFRREEELRPKFTVEDSCKEGKGVTATLTEEVFENGGVRVDNR